MTEYQRVCRNNKLTRLICLEEIRQGKAGLEAYHRAILETHKPGGIRERVNAMYPVPQFPAGQASPGPRQS
jgi:hypothetical protein